MHAPVIVLLGPTGVGKTSLAIELARALGSEIVSADSRQVYRGMDIGTAKPTPAQQKSVRHHLIDVVDPDETFSLALFCDLARSALEELLGQSRPALLVGGTGQYLAAILEGWKVPRVAPQPALRARLREQAQAQGTAALYDRLRQVDPEAAARILPGNLRRIIRALEVYEVTGEPFSRQQGREPPPYDFLILGLTTERPALYQRVDRRAEGMIQRGLVEEVGNLLEQGYGWNLPSMSGLGYIQIRPYLEGDASLETVLTQLKHDTHSFIRHQYTWFRRFPVHRWFDADRSPQAREPLPAVVLPYVNEWLAG